MYDDLFKPFLIATIYITNIFSCRDDACCFILADVCDPNPCLNDGQCLVDMRTVTTPVCNCVGGWYGDICTESKYTLTNSILYGIYMELRNALLCHHVVTMTLSRQQITLHENTNRSKCVLRSTNSFS